MAAAGSGSEEHFLRGKRACPRTSSPSSTEHARPSHSSHKVLLDDAVLSDSSSQGSQTKKQKECSSYKLRSKPYASIDGGSDRHFPMHSLQDNALNQLGLKIPNSDCSIYKFSDDDGSDIVMQGASCSRTGNDAVVLCASNRFSPSSRRRATQSDDSNDATYGRDGALFRRTSQLSVGSQPSSLQGDMYQHEELNTTNISSVLSVEQLQQKRKVRPLCKNDVPRQNKKFKRGLPPVECDYTSIDHVAKMHRNAGRRRRNLWRYGLMKKKLVGSTARSSFAAGVLASNRVLDRGQTKQGVLIFRRKSNDATGEHQWELAADSGVKTAQNKHSAGKAKKQYKSCGTSSSSKSSSKVPLSVRKTRTQSERKRTEFCKARSVHSKKVLASSVKNAASLQSSHECSTDASNKDIKLSSSSDVKLSTPDTTFGVVGRSTGCARRGRPPTKRLQQQFGCHQMLSAASFSSSVRSDASTGTGGQCFRPGSKRRLFRPIVDLSLVSNKSWEEYIDVFDDFIFYSRRRKYRRQREQQQPGEMTDVDGNRLPFLTNFDLKSSCQVSESFTSLSASKIVHMDALPSGTENALEFPTSGGHPISGNETTSETKQLPKSFRKSAASAKYGKPVNTHPAVQDSCAGLSDRRSSKCTAKSSQERDIPVNNAADDSISQDQCADSGRMLTRGKTNRLWHLFARNSGIQKLGIANSKTQQQPQQPQRQRRQSKKKVTVEQQQQQSESESRTRELLKLCRPCNIVIVDVLQCFQLLETTGVSSASSISSSLCKNQSKCQSPTSLDVSFSSSVIDMSTKLQSAVKHRHQLPGGVDRTLLMNQIDRSSASESIVESAALTVLDQQKIDESGHSLRSVDDKSDSINHVAPSTGATLSGETVTDDGLVLGVVSLTGQQSSEADRKEVSVSGETCSIVEPVVPVIEAHDIVVVNQLDESIVIKTTESGVMNYSCSGSNSSQLLEDPSISSSVSIVSSSSSSSSAVQTCDLKVDVDITLPDYVVQIENSYQCVVTSANSLQPGLQSDMTCAFVNQSCALPPESSSSVQEETENCTGGGGGSFARDLVSELIGVDDRNQMPSIEVMFSDEQSTVTQQQQQCSKPSANAMLPESCSSATLLNDDKLDATGCDDSNTLEDGNIICDGQLHNVETCLEAKDIKITVINQWCNVNDTENVLNTDEANVTYHSQDNVLTSSPFVDAINDSESTVSSQLTAFLSSQKIDRVVTASVQQAEKTESVFGPNRLSQQWSDTRPSLFEAVRFDGLFLDSINNDGLSSVVQSDDDGRSRRRRKVTTTVHCGNPFDVLSSIQTLHGDLKSSKVQLDTGRTDVENTDAVCQQQPDREGNEGRDNQQFTDCVASSNEGAEQLNHVATWRSEVANAAGSEEIDEARLSEVTVAGREEHDEAKLKVVEQHSAAKRYDYDDVDTIELGDNAVNLNYCLDNAEQEHEKSRELLRGYVESFRRNCIEHREQSSSGLDDIRRVNLDENSLQAETSVLQQSHLSLSCEMNVSVEPSVSEDIGSERLMSLKQHINNDEPEPSNVISADESSMKQCSSCVRQPESLEFVELRVEPYQISTELNLEDDNNDDRYQSPHRQADIIAYNHCERFVAVGEGMEFANTEESGIAAAAQQAAHRDLSNVAHQQAEELSNSDLSPNAAQQVSGERNDDEVRQDAAGRQHDDRLEGSNTDELPIVVVVNEMQADANVCAEPTVDDQPITRSEANLCPGPSGVDAAESKRGETLEPLSVHSDDRLISCEFPAESALCSGRTEVVSQSEPSKPVLSLLDAETSHVERSLPAVELMGTNEAVMQMETAHLESPHVAEPNVSVHVEAGAAQPSQICSPAAELTMREGLESAVMESFRVRRPGLSELERLKCDENEDTTELDSCKDLAVDSTLSEHCPSSKEMDCDVVKQQELIIATTCDDVESSDHELSESDPADSELSCEPATEQKQTLVEPLQRSIEELHNWLGEPSEPAKEKMPLSEQANQNELPQPAVRHLNPLSDDEPSCEPVTSATQQCESDPTQSHVKPSNLGSEESTSLPCEPEPAAVKNDSENVEPFDVELNKSNTNMAQTQCESLAPTASCDLSADVNLVEMEPCQYLEKRLDSIEQGTERTICDDSSGAEQRSLQVVRQQQDAYDEDVSLPTDSETQIDPILEHAKLQTATEETYNYKCMTKLQSSFSVQNELVDGSLKAEIGEQYSDAVHDNNPVDMKLSPFVDEPGIDSKPFQVPIIISAQTVSRQVEGMDNDTHAVFGNEAYVGGLQTSSLQMSPVIGFSQQLEDVAEVDVCSNKSTVDELHLLKPEVDLAKWDDTMKTEDLEESSICPCGSDQSSAAFKKPVYCVVDIKGETVSEANDINANRWATESCQTESCSTSTVIKSDVECKDETIDFCQTGSYCASPVAKSDVEFKDETYESCQTESCSTSTVVKSDVECKDETNDSCQTGSYCASPVAKSDVEFKDETYESCQTESCSTLTVVKSDVECKDETNDSCQTGSYCASQVVKSDVEFKDETNDPSFHRSEQDMIESRGEVNASAEESVTDAVGCVDRKTIHQLHQSGFLKEMMWACHICKRLFSLHQLAKEHMTRAHNFVFSSSSSSASSIGHNSYVSESSSSDHSNLVSPSSGAVVVGDISCSGAVQASTSYSVTSDVASLEKSQTQLLSVSSIHTPVTSVNRGLIAISTAMICTQPSVSTSYSSPFYSAATCAHSSLVSFDNLFQLSTTSRPIIAEPASVSSRPSNLLRQNPSAQRGQSEPQSVNAAAFSDISSVKTRMKASVNFEVTSPSVLSSSSLSSSLPAAAATATQRSRSSATTTLLQEDDDVIFCRYERRPQSGNNPRLPSSTTPQQRQSLGREGQVRSDLASLPLSFPRTRSDHGIECRQPASVDPNSMRDSIIRRRMPPPALVNAVPVTRDNNGVVASSTVLHGMQQQQLRGLVSQQPQHFLPANSVYQRTTGPVQSRNIPLSSSSSTTRHPLLKLQHIVPPNVGNTVVKPTVVSQQHVPPVSSSHAENRARVSIAACEMMPAQLSDAKSLAYVSQQQPALAAVSAGVFYQPPRSANVGRINPQILSKCELQQQQQPQQLQLAGRTVGQYTIEYGNVQSNVTQAIRRPIMSAPSDSKDLGFPSSSRFTQHTAAAAAESTGLTITSSSTNHHRVKQIAATVNPIQHTVTQSTQQPPPPALIPIAGLNLSKKLAAAAHFGSSSKTNTSPYQQQLAPAAAADVLDLTYRTTPPAAHLQLQQQQQFASGGDPRDRPVAAYHYHLHPSAAALSGGYRSVHGSDEKIIGGGSISPFHESSSSYVPAGRGGHMQVVVESPPPAHSKTRVAVTRTDAGRCVVLPPSTSEQQQLFLQQHQQQSRELSRYHHHRQQLAREQSPAPPAHAAAVVRLRHFLHERDTLPPQPAHSLQRRN